MAIADIGMPAIVGARSLIIIGRHLDVIDLHSLSSKRCRRRQRIGRKTPGGDSHFQHDQQRAQPASTE